MRAVEVAALVKRIHADAASGKAAVFPTSAAETLLRGLLPEADKGIAGQIQRDLVALSERQVQAEDQKLAAIDTALRRLPK